MAKTRKNVTVGKLNYEVRVVRGREYVDVLSEGGDLAWRGNPGFLAHLTLVERLKPAPSNLRRNHDVSAIASSMREHGQQDWVKFNKQNEVIAGNGRLLAATSELNWPLIAAGRFAGNANRQSNYAIADNRTGEISEWDYEGLALVLPALEEFGFDPLDFGWTERDLRYVTAQSLVTDAPEEFPAFDGAVVTAYCCPKCGYEWSGKPGK